MLTFAFKVLLDTGKGSVAYPFTLAFNFKAFEDFLASKRTNKGRVPTASTIRLYHAALLYLVVNLCGKEFPSSWSLSMKAFMKTFICARGPRSTKTACGVSARAS